MLLNRLTSYSQSEATSTNNNDFTTIFNTLYFELSFDLFDK